MLFKGKTLKTDIEVRKNEVSLADGFIGVFEDSSFSFVDSNTKSNV